METLAEIKSWIGDDAITNVLLGWCAFELRRAFPYVRALAAHFKLEVTPSKEPAQP